MRGLKDFIPFQGESIGSLRVRKSLAFALIVGLLQTLSWTYQAVEAPQAVAATTYTPTSNPTGTTWTIPTGVDTITFTALGGGAGQGGLDGAGNTVRYPGPRGYVSGSLRLAAGTVLGFYPGRAGANGTTGTNTGGGAGGIGTYPTVNYSGGTGGNSGTSGSSGGGGGGGAASVLTVGGTVYAVAGGAGGAGGSANWAGSGQNGLSTNSSNTGVNTGGNGVQTSTSNAGSGRNCTNSTNDGGGGGGGGGGSFGGSGGGLQNAGTGECSGLGGNRGNNFLISNSALTGTTNTTDPNASNANNGLEGAIAIAVNLSVPSSISISASIQSFTVSWATAAAAQSFRIRIYNAAGNTLLQTVSVAAGTYSRTITSSDFASIATNTSYQVSVTAIGNSEAPYIDSAESAKFLLTTSTSSEFDSALSLNGSNQSASVSGAQVIPTATSSTFSVEAWIRQPASRSSTAFYQILSQGPSGNVFYAKVVDGSVRFGRSGYTAENICEATVPTDAWTHVALIVGNTSQSCYINGALSGSFTQNSSTAIGTTFAIGQFAPSGTELFLGQIDEVKIWSSDRSASVTTDMQTYNPSASGLIAYYDFNELIGEQIINRTTGGLSAYDLTRIGTPGIARIEATTINQAYTVVTFPRTYLVANGGWRIPSTVSNIKSLVVAGGGAGGSRAGGGGGAGGYVFDGNLAVNKNETYSVVVGAGGIGSALKAGNNGGNSSLGNLRIAIGGGGGGAATGASNCCERPGKNGGSGGGASGGNSVGTTSQNSTYLYGSGNNGGTAEASGNWPGGGGGGANLTTGTGGNGSGSTAGKGGNGILDPIGGTSTCYATGGGGGIYQGQTAGQGGDCGGASSPNTNSGTSSRTVPAAARANTGSGGGGTGWFGNDGDVAGGNGASGVVIISYITNTPTIINQPLSDTTTAGIVETFTITTTAAPSPLTKSVQWQFTADTTTVLVENITGWTNASTGSGFTTDTFTTISLTKSMNKYRYRAIVTFSDTSNLSVVETSTVAILTINDSITITSSTTTITRKYGETQTVRTISYLGGTTSTGAVGTSTSHTVRGGFGTLASGKIVLDTSTSTTVFRVDTGTVVGTYTETITVTDFKGATATYIQRVVVNPADTLTVQADTLTAIAFGGTLSPTVTVTGLVSGDSVATTTFGHVSCANGGTCAIGDIGPGGGVVFYIAGSTDSQTAVTGITGGGIYLEAAPVGWGNGIAVSAGETTGTPYLDPVVNWCNTFTSVNNNVTGIGKGGINTKNMDDACSSGAGQIASDLVLNGRNDWYLPSESELVQMGLQKNLIGLLYGVNNCYSNLTCYWSSTDDSGSSARALQVNVGTNNMGANNRTLDASNKVMMRPIRAFSPITNGSETVTAGAPTAAGTYSIRPTAITLANGVDTSNYVAITYRSSITTINRALATPRVSMQAANVAYDTGTATQVLTATSGPGTGAIFYMIGSGSATGCSISGSTVRNTSDGVCNVIAFKQASTNYLADSATAVAITFLRFVSRPPQVQLYPSMIPLNQGNALETTTATVPVITSIVYDPGGSRMVDGNIQVIAPSYTINGSGFTGATRIVLNFNDVTTFTTKSDTEIYVRAEYLITSGILFIECSDGRIGPTPFYRFNR